MKIFVAILVFTSLLLMAEAVNYKKAYCGNQEFVGNAANKTPHLHCEKNHLTLTRNGGKQHTPLHGNCNKVNEILGDIPGFYGMAKNPAAITAVLVRYHTDGCPTTSKLANLLFLLLQN